MVIFFIAIQSIIFVLALLFIVTQIVVPAMRNRKLFPMFSSKKSVESLEVEINEVKDEKAVQQKVKALNKVKGNS